MDVLSYRRLVGNGNYIILVDHIIVNCITNLTRPRIVRSFSIKRYSMIGLGKKIT